MQYGKLRSAYVVTVPLLLCAIQAGAQPASVAKTPDCIVVTACRCIHPVPRPQPQHVELTAVNAKVDIVERVATTTLTLTLQNHWSRPQEAQVLVPIPGDAVVRGFGYDGATGETTARLLPRDEARRLYESIVASSRDPGLLEFAGSSAIRSSTFPVPPNSSQRVWITYEQILNADNNRYDYVLLRSESLESPHIPWQLTLNIRSQSPIVTVYSPSHLVEVAVGSPTQRTVTLTPQAANTPGSFRLSVLHDRGGLTGSLIAYPPIGGEDGYFLLLTGAPPVEHVAGPRARREVILVLDRSGSMRGEKFEQARGAAIQVIEGLAAGELFNIIDYSDRTESFSEKPLAKSAESLSAAREYLNRLEANGGTNIHEALLRAMAQPHDAETLPIILFLTDGLPTVGNTNELDIRKHAAEANTHKRRVFTFGVGYDLNAPLLDRIAMMGRGASVNVLPDENIEVAVSKVFTRLAGPVLEYPRLVAIAADSATDTQRIYDVLPAELPDLFEGEHLVVLGRYRGNEPLRLRLSGRRGATDWNTTMTFPLEQATVANGHVPRLWAGRRIGFLVDEIRQQGPSGGPGTDNRELVDEIVRLSVKFGILTEYTSFLATDSGSPLAASPRVDHTAAAGAAQESLKRRASKDRAGKSAVTQSLNIKAQQAQSCLNVDNRYYDENMKEVTVRSVQQLCDQTFFRRGERWIDARLMTDPNAAAVEPQKTIEFASTEYFRLAQQLSEEGRAGLIALRGDVLLRVGDESVLVRNPME